MSYGIFYLKQKFYQMFKNLYTDGIKTESNMMYINV